MRSHSRGCREVGPAPTTRRCLSDSVRVIPREERSERQWEGQARRFLGGTRHLECESISSAEHVLSAPSAHRRVSSFLALGQIESVRWTMRCYLVVWFVAMLTGAAVTVSVEERTVLSPAYAQPASLSPCSWGADYINESELHPPTPIHRWDTPMRDDDINSQCAGGYSVIQNFIPDPAAISATAGSTNTCAGKGWPLCSGQVGPAHRETYALDFSDGFVNECFFNAWTRCDGHTYGKSFEFYDDVTSCIVIDDAEPWCDKRLRMLWTPESEVVVNSQGFASAQIYSNWEATVTVEDCSDESRKYVFKHVIDQKSQWSSSIASGWTINFGLNVDMAGVDWSVEGQSTIPVTDSDVRAEGIPSPSGGTYPPQPASLCEKTLVVTTVRHTMGIAWVAVGNGGERRGSIAQGAITKFEPNLVVLVEGAENCSDRLSASWNDQSYDLDNFQTHFCNPRWPGAFGCGCPDR